MKSKYLDILNSELLRNTSILISGTVFAQIIPILLQPVLRRFFTPETFGAYSVYLSLLGILIVVSSLRYEPAIILPTRDKDAMALFFLSILLSFGFNLTLFLVILLWKSEIISFLNLSERYAIYLYLTPPGVFLFSVNQSINYWLIRKKKFFSISVNKFVRRGFEGSGQLICMVSKITNGLIYGDLIGHSANIFSGIYQGLRSGLSFTSFSPVKIRYVFTKYSEYPRYNLIPAFMDACRFLLPVLMINKYFSSENTGYFDLSKMLLSIPLALVATSLSNVLLQRINEKGKLKLSIKKDLLITLYFVLIIVIAEISIILIFGESLFRIVFGSEWEFSGTISKILVWSFTFNFLTSCFTSIFISLNKIKLFSVWQIFYFASILLLFFFSYLSFISFLKVYVLIEVICSLIISIIILKVVIDYEQKVPSNIKGS